MTFIRKHLIDILFFIYSVIIFVISIIRQNLDGLILAGVMWLTLISTNLIVFISHKRSIKLMEWYLPLRDAGHFEEIISRMASHCIFYFEKVTFTSTFLFKGDQKSYEENYAKISKNGIRKWQYYRFLHFGHSYYEFLMSGPQAISFLVEDSQYPVNNLLNLVKNKQFSDAISFSNSLPPFHTAFMNYLVVYVQYICKREMGQETIEELENMKKLAEGNPVLQKSLHSLNSFGISTNQDW